MIDSMLDLPEPPSWPKKGDVFEFYATALISEDEEEGEVEIDYWPYDGSLTARYGGKVIDLRGGDYDRLSDLGHELYWEHIYNKEFEMEGM